MATKISRQEAINEVKEMYDKHPLNDRRTQALEIALQDMNTCLKPPTPPAHLIDDWYSYETEEKW